ncbi:hypothetical protein FSP39_015856 [Pinctada imbricata]|uniref:Uncharacterized protein n=1 Tax=Pinctada imbricata TaxID=66713 RepID=A0AA89BVU7_PINIB|nr:hypothetical protein FSP39_015856 [Pinctada imbricata]
MSSFQTSETQYFSRQFSPSQALQDAKSKLGPVYFDSKLIECPKNAIELSKLRQSLEDIDKQKHKAMEENERAQRVLVHTLQSRYTFSKMAMTSPVSPYVRDNKLPPPGFRYHANGNPKLSLQQSNSTSAKENKETELSTNRARSEAEMIIHSTRIHHNRENGTSDKNEIRTKSSVSSSQDSKTESKEDLDFECEKEVQEIAKIIHELDKELEKCKAKVSNDATPREKALSFMRAHSRSDKDLEMSAWVPLSYSRPNDRFPFQPGSSSFKLKDSESILKRERKATKHSSCIACQYKLKHDSRDFMELKKKTSDNNVQRRWSIAPHGRFLEAPTSSERKPTVTFDTPDRSSSPTSSTRLRRSAKSAPTRRTLLRQTSGSAAGARCASSAATRPKSVNSLLEGNIDFLKNIQKLDCYARRYYRYLIHEDRNETFNFNFESLFDLKYPGADTGLEFTGGVEYINWAKRDPG